MVLENVPAVLVLNDYRSGVGGPGGGNAGDAAKSIGHNTGSPRDGKTAGERIRRARSPY